MPKKFFNAEDRRAYNRNNYHNSDGIYKDKTLKRTKRNHIKIVQFVWDYLKEHPCIECGESDPVVLEFDHIRDKVANISVMMRNNNSIETISEEIAKCEVRCANCHRRKTAIQLGFYKGIVK
jgi:hypothetical protein